MTILKPREATMMEAHETFETLLNRQVEIAEAVMNGQMSAGEAGKERRALDQKRSRMNSEPPVVTRSVRRSRR
jgi:hypothetical protein